jgi:hypothetical protein
MRPLVFVSFVLAAASAGCASNTGPGTPADVRIKVRLENQDPHLYDVTTVDLDLRRDNVVVHDSVGDTDHPFAFPSEVIIKVPIGAGPLTIEATPRGGSGVSLGGGEGTVVATGDAVASVTIGLLSDRNRPSRGHNPEPDAGLAPDAAAPDAEVAAGAPDAGADEAIATPDGPAPACTPRTHHLVAQAVVSVDYGSLPRDREDSRVSVSSGFAHDHVHAFVGWMRFDLSEIPPGAKLNAMNVGLVLTMDPEGHVPRLAIVYSADDQWDPDTLTSETADTLPRTAPLSGDLGTLRSARALYPVDVSRYQSYWAGDLADHLVTIGMISTTAPDSPETWCDFYGLDPAELAPYLDLETCE